MKERDILVFTDNDGQEINMEILDYFEYDEEEYAMLVEVEEHEHDDECDHEHEEDEDSAISTMAAKDKILWKVICEEAKDENQHLSDRDDEGAETNQSLSGVPNGVVNIENSSRSSAVGFVFFKCSNQ